MGNMSLFREKRDHVNVLGNASFFLSHIKTINVTGNFQAQELEAIDINITGQTTIKESHIEKLSIIGPASLDHLKSQNVKVIGDLTVSHSNIDQLTATAEKVNLHAVHIKKGITIQKSSGCKQPQEIFIHGNSHIEGSIIFEIPGIIYLEEGSRISVPVKNARVSSVPQGQKPQGF